MGVKKIKDKKAATPKKSSAAKEKGKMTKAHEAVRAEIRSILSAAREKNLIQKTTTTVKKVRSFTTEDILSFISDVKVKTKEEVKKVIPKRATSSSETAVNTTIQSQANIETPPKHTTMSYYDRWYNIVSKKEQ